MLIGFLASLECDLFDGEFYIATEFGRQLHYFHLFAFFRSVGVG